MEILIQQDMQERRKAKKRKEAHGEINKYPGLTFNPEIELKKWEIREQEKQRHIEVSNDSSSFFPKFSHFFENYVAKPNDPNCVFLFRCSG